METTFYWLWFQFSLLIKESLQFWKTVMFYSFRIHHQMSFQLKIWWIQAKLELLSYFREEAPFQATLSINLREPVEPDLIESRVIFQRVSAMNGKVINKPRWYSATFKLAGQKKASLTTDFYDDVEVEEDDY